MDFEAHALDFGLVTQVFSEGPIGAEIALVGEGPGEQEVAKGRPFIGGSGKFLFDTLKRVKLDRTSVYVTNVVKRQISLSRTGGERAEVKRDEFERWVSMLDWELGHLPNLKTILVMGNTLWKPYSENKITNWRGSVIHPVKYPETERNRRLYYQSAYALRELKLEPVFTLNIVTSWTSERWNVQAV
jgi:uracil-DNA glycosylase family 4